MNDYKSTQTQYREKIIKSINRTCLVCGKLFIYKVVEKEKGGYGFDGSLKYCSEICYRIAQKQRKMDEKFKERREELNKIAVKNLDELKVELNKETQQFKEQLNKFVQALTTKYDDRMNKMLEELYIKQLTHIAKKPMTEPEIKLERFLKQNNFNFKFVGDKSLWIGKRNPDFIDNDGKKIIEMFGDYYHKGENEEEKQAFFKQYGFKTLIIWEHELKNQNQLLGKIAAFMREN